MITLEAVTADDSERILAWRNLPQVSEWMYTDHVITASEHQAWFERMLASPLHHYWIVRWCSQPAGVVNLIRESDGHRGELGIYIAEESAKGTGAAAGAVFLSIDRAFAELGVQRVICEALAHNDHAIALYERTGFRREGYFRSHVRRDQKQMDVVCLGLLVDEWSMLRSGLRSQLAARGILSEEDDHG